MSESVRTTRPAVDVLDRGQDQLLFESEGSLVDQPPLIAGFGSWWELLLWYQTAGVWTLGHVDRVLEPREIMPTAPIVDQLLGDHDSASYTRQRLAESIDRTCRRAFRQLFDRADERIETEGTESSLATVSEIEPDREANPAMRPALQKLDEQQESALSELWTGFESRHELSRWARSTAAATAGLETDEIQTEIARSPSIREALLDQDRESAIMTRYRLAVGKLLPAMLAADRRLRGTEQSETTGTERSTFDL